VIGEVIVIDLPPIIRGENRYQRLTHLTFWKIDLCFFDTLVCNGFTKDQMRHELLVINRESLLSFGNMT